MGSVLELGQAYTTTPPYTGDGIDADAGFIESNRIAIGGKQVGATFLFADNATKLREEANNTSTAIRDAAFLAQAGAAAGFTDGTVTDLTNGFQSRAATGAEYDGDGDATDDPVDIPITVITDRFDIARYAHVSSGGQAGDAAGSFVIAGGTEVTGTLTGAYQWTGHLSYGNVGAFTSVTTVETNIATPDINAAAPRLDFTIPTSAASVGLTGFVTLNKTTGVLASSSVGGTLSGLTFQTGSGQQTAATFAGRLHGSGAISLSGVFASLGAQINSRSYGGAVIASGKADQLTHLAGGAFDGTTITGTPTIASGNYALATHPATEAVYVVAPVGSSILFDANHASAVIRTGALVGNLANSTGTNTEASLAQREIGDDPFAVHTRTAQVTIGGAEHNVTFYQDIAPNVSQSAATLAVVGPASGGAPLTLVAGGNDSVISAARAGTYNWAGLHLQGLANASDIATLARGRFELAITFTSGSGTASFQYEGGVLHGSSLSASGTATKSSGSFVSADTAAGFTYTVDASTSITDGTLYGRIGGADLFAVSGVFATSRTGATNYAGGFVGAGPQVARVTDYAGNAHTGFGVAQVSIDGAGANDTSKLVFASRRVLRTVINANSSSQTERAASLLESIDSTGTGTGNTPGTAGSDLGIDFTTDGSFSQGTDTRTIDVYDSGSGRFFYVQFTHGSLRPFSAYVAGAPTGTIAAGAYTWQGLHQVGHTDRGRFEIRANLTAESTADTFTYTTLTNQIAANIAGNGSIDRNTGLLVANIPATGNGTITLSSGAAGSITTSNLALRGEITGVAGTGVVGVFISQGETPIYGGFTGTGKQDVVTILPVTGDFGLGYVAGRSIGTGSEDGLAFIGDAYGALLAVSGSALDATRDTSVIATIAPTFSGSPSDTATTSDNPEARYQTISGTNPSGATGDYAVTKWLNVGDNASLLRLNGTGVTGSNQGSFYVAGGQARTASGVLTGGFTWAGALVVGTRDLESATEPAVTGFQLTADFSLADAAAGNGVFTGNISQGALSANTRIDRATGRISLRDGAQIQIASVDSGGALSGFVVGSEAQGVSGVFATSAIAGGFVGGAPQVGRNLFVNTVTEGLSIGQARRTVYSGTDHDDGGILFLGGTYDARRTALNVVSDTTRDAQILSSLGVATTVTGTASGGLTKYADQSISVGTSTATATIWQDSRDTVRLFAFNDLFVAGGKTLSGTLSGTYEYEGVFVSADGSTLGTVREGTFELDANFTAQTFTFTGTTTDASGTQDSRLVVSAPGTSNHGTLDRATGVLTADAASYIHGSGDTHTANARFAGQVFGDGGTGVAGLFTTTGTGTKYVGGFAGAVTDLVQSYGTTPTYAGDSNSAFITSNRLAIGGEQVGPTFLFVTNDQEDLIDAANSATAAIRDHAFLARAGRAQAGNSQDFTFASNTSPGNGISSTSATGATYDSDGDGTTASAVAIPITVYADTTGAARFAYAEHTASHTTGDVGSFVIAGGEELTGTLTGAYTWVGEVGYGDAASFGGGLTLADTTITAANLGADNPELTVALPSGVTAGLLGALSLDTDTGLITNATNAGGASTLEFQSGTSSGTPNKGVAVFAGRLHGSRGIALSGVFASTGAQIDSKNWAGALVAGGDASRLRRLAGAAFNGPQIAGIPTIARGDYALASHPATQEVYVVAPVGSSILFDANHASDSIRGNALVGNLGSLTGANTALNPAPAQRVADEGTLTVHTRTSQVTIDGTAHTVTVYQDIARTATQSAATLAVVGPASGGAPLTLVAGGNDPFISGTTAGTYNWAGLHLQGLADASALTGLATGRFELEITFTTGSGTASFQYEGGVLNGSSLSASGTATKSSGSFVSGAGGTGFTYTADASTSITDGKLYGRFGGADLHAVSGVFATSRTNGANYAGGFVGAGPQVARVTDYTGNATSGFGLTRASIDDAAAADKSELVFASTDILRSVINANSSSQTLRAASLFESLDSTGTGTGNTAHTDTGSDLGIGYKTGGAFTSQGSTWTVNVFDSGSGRFFHVDSGHASIRSFSAYVAGARTGTTVTGEYTWQGLHQVGASDQGRFEITANLTGGTTDTFTYETLSNQSAANIDGNGSINNSTGLLVANIPATTTDTITLSTGSAGSITSSKLALRGRITGDAGAGVVGVFISEGSSPAIGGFAGTGKQDVVTILPVDGNFGLGYVAGRTIAAGGANGFALIGDKYTELLAASGSALDATRNASVVANINPTLAGAPGAVTISDNPEARAQTITGGTNPSGTDGENYVVTKWLNVGDNASLLRLNGAGFTNSNQGSFYVAGGQARTAQGNLTGGFTWAGALVVGTRDLESAPAVTGFQLTADFSLSGTNTGNGVLTGNISQGAISANTRIDQDTGRISLRDGAQIQIAGADSGGALSGFVVGTDAEGVSGVFATSAVAGGFVGGAPQVGRDLYANAGTAATDYSIGQAKRSVFSGTDHGNGGILFLGADYDNRRDRLNVVSDTARNAQILSNLGVTTTGTGTASAGLTTKYVTQSVSFGSSNAPATIWQDSTNTVRLFAVSDLFVAGGKAQSGAPSGIYAYEGVFVSAIGTTLGAVREGRFDLSANFTDGTFTFTGTTTDSDGDQNSRLVVTTGGSVTASTGVLTATTGAYTEGTGTDDSAGLATRLDARLYGSGGTGVAGLFTTTAGTKYVGGFAGAVRNLVQAYSTTPTYAGDDNSAFITSSRLAIGGAQVGQTFLFVTNNEEDLILAANNSTASVRDHSFLARAGASSVATSTVPAVTTGTFSTIGNGISRATASGATYDGDGDADTNSPVAIPINVYADTFRLARFAHARHTTSHTAGAYGSFVIAGGADLTGTLTGAYEWVGRIGYADAAAFGGNLSFVNTTITATNLGVDAPVLTFALPTPTSAGLTGTLSLDKNTGVLTNGTTGSGGTASSALSFQTDGVAANKVAAVFAGRLHGSQAIALAGVFATADAQVGGTTDYAGALVAAGAVDLELITGPAFSALPTTALTLARGQLAVNVHAASTSVNGGAYFLVPQGSNAIVEASHASTAIRNASVVASLASIAGTSAAHTVPTRAAGDGEITIGRHTSGDLTVYQDRPGASSNASLVFAGGSSNADRLIAASGAPTSGAAGFTGSYTYEGAHFLGAASDLSALKAGRFTLTYSTGSGFSYTGGTDTAADGELTASSSVAGSGSFSASITTTGLAGGELTQGTIYGRFSGTGITAVSGVFFGTNASGTVYAGGFVGGAPQVVRSTAALQGDGAFGVGNVTLDSDATKSRVVFVTDDYADLASEANVVSDNARAGNILESIDTTTVANTGGASITTTTTAGTTIATSTGGSFAYRGGRVALDIHAAGSAARLFKLNNSSVSGGVDSLLAYVAQAHTGGTLAAGAYTWRGIQISGARGSLETTDQAQFELKGSINADGTATLGYTTIGADSSDFTLSGSVTLSAAGILAHAGTGLDFDPDGGDTTLSAVKVDLRGELAGTGGAGLVGLFATNLAGATTEYAGGFVGAAPVYATADGSVSLAGDAGFINGSFLFDGIADDQALSILARNTGNLLAGINSTSDATSGAALLNSLNTVTLTGSESDAFSAAAKQQGGTISVGGSTSAVLRLQSRNAAARVLFVNAPSASAFIAAGGTGFAHTGTPDADNVIGVYTYEGAQSLAALDSDYASPEFGGFSLVIDFHNETGTYTGQKITIGSNPNQVAATLTTTADNLTLVPSLGTLGGTASLAVDGEATATPAVIRARIHGEYATAVSGVFATTGGSGDQYAGGFAGGRRTLTLTGETAFPDFGGSTNPAARRGARQPTRRARLRISVCLPAMSQQRWCG